MQYSIQPVKYGTGLVMLAVFHVALGGVALSPDRWDCDRTLTRDAALCYERFLQSMHDCRSLKGKKRKEKKRDDLTRF